MIFKNMKPVSTLENFNKISHGRATGNTTRLIDHAVQLLFEGNVVLVRDAWENGRNKLANEYLFNGIIKRMSVEHNNVKLKLNKKEFSIVIESSKF